MCINERLDARAIIKLISESVKKTKTRAFISGALGSMDWSGTDDFSAVRGKDFCTLSGDYFSLAGFIDRNASFIDSYEIEPPAARNSAVPMADLTKYEARIEPGAIIREMAEIGKGAVIMMGAAINIGASVGPGTMIDMNAVIGGRAAIGANCHIGAGAVVAGVIEPASATPTVVEDGVFVGANAVLLEGVRVGRGSVVAAGAVVISDVEPGVVVAGAPAKTIKKIDEVSKTKISIVDALRQL